MQRLRSILFILFLTVFTPFYACLCLICFPFLNTAQRYHFVSKWNLVTLFVAKHLCGIHYRFLGWENCTAVFNQPVIVLSKHQSAWETIALLAFFPKRLSYVFKRELLFVPFFGWVLGLLRMVHIDRKQGSHAFSSIVEQGKKCLSEGAWIILFPEGTRIPSGAKGKYKTGGARLAIATNSMVLPIAHNAGRYWPKHTIVKQAGLITVSIGPAISSAGKTPEELNKEVEAWIEKEMRIIDADSYLSEPSIAKQLPPASDASLTAVSPVDTNGDAMPVSSLPSSPSAPSPASPSTSSTHSTPPKSSPSSGPL